MITVQKVTENQVLKGNDNQTTIRQKIAGLLAEVPEPAAQTAALQLLKTRITLDRSFAFFMGALAMVVAEELL